jgi:hypothetical protein
VSVKTWTIQSSFVKAEIQNVGAMVGPAWFNLGRTQAQPFAVAPWAESGSAEHAALPGILQRLRGEWPCVPFGITNTRTLPADWQPRTSTTIEPDPHPHGLSSNAQWHLADLQADRITLTLRYPESHAVAVLTRIISASRLQPQLDFSLRIEVREPCELPIGLHPTFRVSQAPRQTLLDLGSSASVWTSPVPLEPGVPYFESDIRGTSPSRVPVRAGVEDITRLPLPRAAEEIVLAIGHEGRASLQNLEEAYRATLSWDPVMFPACLLWLSNGGRTYYPWDGRFRAIGIEPVRSAFDLGTVVSRERSNPLWQVGVPCVFQLSPTAPFETRYCVTLTTIP